MLLLRHIKIFFSSARYHRDWLRSSPLNLNFVLKPSPRDLVKVGSKSVDVLTLSLPVTDLPPLAAMGQGRGACDTLRVPQSVHPQRAAPERVVSTRVVRTYPHRGGHHGTLSGTLSVWHTADARRVRAAYRQLTPPRAGLAHGACSLTAPRRHRRPHSSHTDRHRCHCQLTYLVRLESVLPTTLNAHQPAGCATHVTVATARVPSHPLQLSTACACRYVQ